MKESNSGWKFWVGLAAGIAAGWYLNSEEGRRWRRQAGDRLNEWGSEMNEIAEREMNQLSAKATESLERSKGFADSTRHNLKQKVEKLSRAAEDLIDKTEENYEKAADWANKKLNDGPEKA